MSVPILWTCNNEILLGSVSSSLPKIQSIVVANDLVLSRKQFGFPVSGAKAIATVNSLATRHHDKKQRG
jgi:hypothetical protein